MVISIQKATYKGNYKIEILFSDGVKKVVDFENFIKSSKNPMTNKYLDKEKFKSFSLDYGDIVWNDYELCFPIWDLHEGRI
jgi:hypothetical protein